MKRRRPLRRSEGQALIEFALTVPLLLAIVLGVWNLTTLIQDYTTVTDLASDTARLWSRPENHSLNQSDLEAIILDSLGETNISSSTVSVTVATQPDPNDASLNQRIVTIDFGIQPVGPARLFGFQLFDPTLVVTARAIYPEEQPFY